MAGRYRDTVSDSELMARVLDRIWERGEVIESDLYPLVGSHSRIRPLLERMCESGILDVRLRTRGQRVPVYSYAKKGRLFYLANRLCRDMIDGGEVDVESGDVSEIYGNLKRLYEVRTDDRRCARPSS